MKKDEALPTLSTEELAEITGGVYRRARQAKKSPRGKGPGKHAN